MKFFIDKATQSAIDKPVVGVFCSSNDKIPEKFKKITFELGSAFAIRHFGLVTGACKTGLMKEVVDGYLSHENNQHLYGVMPVPLKELQELHTSISQDNIAWTHSVHQRLEVFIEKCDYVVILPGGWGTLHELVDFLAHQQLELTNKKIILFNIDGYWDNLLKQFKIMMEMNALQQEHFNKLVIVSSIEECLEAISKDNGK